MGRIVIDNEKCKACKICIEVCPKKLIKQSDLTNAHGVNYAEFHDKDNACIGCAMCALSCPDAAICEVYR